VVPDTVCFIVIAILWEYTLRPHAQCPEGAGFVDEAPEPTQLFLRTNSTDGSDTPVVGTETDQLIWQFLKQ